jgi:hypothetical protein
MVAMLCLIDYLTTLSVSRPYNDNDTVITECEIAGEMGTRSYKTLKFNHALNITKLFSFTSSYITWFINWLLFVSEAQHLVCEVRNELQ